MTSRAMAPLGGANLRAAAPIAAACLGAMLVLGPHLRLPGLALLAAAAVWAAVQAEPLRRRLLSVIGALALLTAAPIGTGLSAGHITAMGVFFILAAALPAIILRRFFHDRVITFPFHHGRRWYRSEIAYVLVWGAFAYLLMPIYFATTGAHRYWTVLLDPRNLIALFLACMGLGIWDELFFVNTVLGIFRRYLPFVWANTAQAAVFTTFLWELGFKGWAPLCLFPFTLLQGYIYQRTRSLLYVITIHLTVDMVLYLALIHAHYPDKLPIFLT